MQVEKHHNGAESRGGDFISWGEHSLHLKKDGRWNDIGLSTKTQKRGKGGEIEMRAPSWKEGGHIVNRDQSGSRDKESKEIHENGGAVTREAVQFQ